MSNLVREFVVNLSDEEKRLILDGYEKFEQDGFIGDEPIRQQAETFMKLNGIRDSGGMVVMWMQSLAFECYRHFALSYFMDLNYDN